MWKKKLIKNKLSFALVGIILLFLSALISSIFIFVSSITDSIYDYYINNSSITDYYIFNSDSSELEKYKDMQDKEKMIKNLKSYDSFYGSMVLSVNGAKSFIEDRTIVIPLSNYKDVEWKLTVLENEKDAVCPNKGEIWISKIFSDQKNIKLGDSISTSWTENNDFKVSAILNDSQNGSVANPVKIIYMNNDDIEKFSIDHKGSFIVFDHVIDESQIHSYIEEKFENNNYYIDRHLLQSNQQSDIEFVSLFMQFAAALVIICSAWVIRFTVKTFLKNDLKAIGTYKALGFTFKEIKHIYLNAYLLTAAVSSIIGGIIGCEIAFVVQRKCLKYIDEFPFNSSYIIISGIVVLLLIFWMWIFMQIELNGIKKISPVESFKLNETEQGLFKFGIFRRNNFPVLQGINDIFRNLSLSFNCIIMIAMFTFVSFFFIDAKNVFDVSDKYANVWLNLHKTSATINLNVDSGEELDKITNLLDNSEYVSDYGYGIYFYGSNYLKLNTEKYGDDYYAFESNSKYDNLGYDITRGRFPEKYDEVNVSEKFLNNLGLDIGDKLSVVINDQKEEFKITGSFGSIKFNGQNVRFLNEIYDHYDIHPKYNIFEVQLKDNSQYSAFKKEFESNILDSLVQKGLGNYQELLKNMTFLLPACVRIIVIFMTTFTLINLLNIISVIIIENRKKIGIHKALGFSDKMIKTRNLTQIVILALIGTGLGFELRNALSRSMLNIFNCPNAIVFSSLKIALYAVFMMIIVVVFTLLFLKKTEKIRVVELMED